MYWLKIDIDIAYIIVVNRVILSTVLKIHCIYLKLYLNSTVTSDGLLQKDCESRGRQWWIISQQVLKIQW